MAHEGLSPRENEVAEALVRGLSDQEISDALGATVGTIGQHRKSIYRKLGVSSREDAVKVLTGEREAEHRGDLTLKEERVAELIRLGWNDKDIAANLGSAVWTIVVQRKSIYRRLGVHNREDCIAALKARPKVLLSFLDQKQYKKAGITRDGA